MSTANPIPITFREVVSVFERIAENHQEINSFHSGFLDEVDIKKLGLKDYAILYIEPSTVNVNVGVLSYSFTVYVMDLADDEKIGMSAFTNTGDVKNQRIGRRDTWNETLLIMQDVISEFRQSLITESYANYKQQLFIQMPVNVEPYTARFNNLLTGWSSGFTLDVNNINEICNIPITDPV